MIKKSIEFLRGSWEEFKKVTWPSKEELTESTFLVVSTIFLVAVFLWGVDKVLEYIVRRLFS